MIRALSVVFLLFAASAQAAEKTDLSEYFVPGGTVGDYVVWRSDADATRSDELLEIYSRKNRIMYVSQSFEDGLSVVNESGQIPGKWLVEGGAIAEGLEIYVAKPFKRLRMQVVPGKVYRYSGSGRVFYLGQRIGKAKVKGTITFVGFGLVESPVWSSSDAATFVESSTITTKIKGGGTLVNESLTRWSTDRELGPFFSVEESRAYENGALVETVGPTTWWLEYGEFGGVPFP